MAARHKFANSLVGFFMGKSVAFSLVQNYVTNTWGKFGFQRVMRDEDDVFYFKFISTNGLEQVLEQGPGMIQNQPLILTRWTPNLSLSKDKVTKVPVWVKIHKVHVVAYSKDELSLIATQIELKREVTMEIPIIDGEGTMSQSIKEMTKPTEDVQDDGFKMVVNRKSKGKSFTNSQKGWRVKNPKENLKYQPVKSKETSFEYVQMEKSIKEPVVKLNGNGGTNSNLYKVDSDSEVDENLIMEKPAVKEPKGASTPSDEVPRLSYNSWLEHGCGNLVKERRTSWVNLGLHKQVVRGCPLSLLRDFNVALNLEDTYSGAASLNLAMVDFKECVADIEVVDINCSGIHFTWNQKPKGGGVAHWNINMPGHSMFQVTSELKALKEPLRKLVHDHDEEVKYVMFGIGEDKAMGPDGFTSAFFKKGWNIVGLDVYDLFMFARGDVNSAQVIMDSLNEFKRVSGLVPSLPRARCSFVMS
nr:hypothetical protein [Tanacetum cinerariifolium]